MSAADDHKSTEVNGSATEDSDTAQINSEYGGASVVETDLNETQVGLVADSLRTDVKFKGYIKEPRRLREALSALYAVVSSDYRYKPKDRTAYLAYRQMKDRAASQALWQSQQTHYQWIINNDLNFWFILDPIVTVHPDGVNFEVFSKDEGSYAQLAIDWTAFEVEGDIQFGTTNIDFTEELYQGIQKIRSYRPTTCQIGKEAVQLGVGDDVVIEKSVRIKESWLRGFLQVQSAGTLPGVRCELTPIDMYNTLRALRLNADRKGEGRAIRFELTPGEQPRLVLEPWEQVIEAQGPAYGGDKAQVVRVWGRRRLLEIKRFLPLAEKVTVHLMGSGLPNFWVLEGGAFRMTLAMTGFTAFNWSEAIEFDQLLPRSKGEDPNENVVVNYLKEHWSASQAEIISATNLEPEVALRALQAACQIGAIMYDLASDVFRYRPLLSEPLERDKFAYRNADERQAADLVASSAVTIEQVKSVPGGGTEVVSQVEVAVDRRTYQTVLRIGVDGRLAKGSCTCKRFRDQGLKHGACSCLIASRIHWGNQVASVRAKRDEQPESLVSESRTFSVRVRGVEERVQLTLDHKRLRVEWGRRGTDQRLQNLTFNHVADARDAYLERIQKLQQRGYMDASSI